MLLVKLQQLNGRMNTQHTAGESTGENTKLRSRNKGNVRVVIKKQDRGRAASLPWTTKSFY